MVPDDAGLRARLAGLGNELLGEQGLIWCIRALALVPRAADEPRLASFAFKYGGSPAEMARAPERIRSILDLLAAVIREQKARGSEYLVGDALSAIDLYWSAASVLLRPEAAFGLPEEAIAVAQGFAALAGDVADDLIEHRDRMFERYYSLPLRLE